MWPQQGDILVSKHLETIDYVVTIVPRETRLSGPHDVAIAKAIQLAKQLQVDAWLTEDNRHFLRIASYRSALH